MNTKKNIVIAIDGPAASGKGTLSQKIAEALNFAHMDTGALYRAVAYEVLQAGGDPESEEDAGKGADLLKNKINAAPSPSIILHNSGLREDNIALAASKVAAIQAVRNVLKELQRNFAQNPGDAYKGAVLDGRDIGTVICPDAPVKLFVTASSEIRAQRRTKELQSKGLDVTKTAVLRDMRERDTRDASRQMAPMKPAEDAIVFDTSDLGQEEMLEKALEIIKGRLSTL